MPHTDDQSDLTVEECKSPESNSRLGCLLGCVFPFIALAYLAHFSLPGTRPAAVKAREPRCQQNLNHIGRAVHLYAQDNDERLPPAVLWTQRIYPRYIEDEKDFRCPESGRLERVTDSPCAARLGVPALGAYSLRGSYAVACAALGGPNGRALASVGHPGEVVLAFDSVGGCVYASDPLCGCSDRATRNGSDYGVDWERHGSGWAYFLFVDGHAGRYPRGYLPPYSWDPTMR